MAGVDCKMAGAGKMTSPGVEGGLPLPRTSPGGNVCIITE